MGIAVADMLVMLEYIPFSIHMYIVNYNNKMEKAWVKIYSILVIVLEYLTSSRHRMLQLNFLVENWKKNFSLH